MQEKGRILHWLDLEIQSLKDDQEEKGYCHEIHLMINHYLYIREKISSGNYEERIRTLEE